MYVLKCVHACVRAPLLHSPAYLISITSLMISSPLPTHPSPLTSPSYPLLFSVTIDLMHAHVTSQAGFDASAVPSSNLVCYRGMQTFDAGALDLATSEQLDKLIKNAIKNKYDIKIASLYNNRFDAVPLAALQQLNEITELDLSGYVRVACITFMCFACLIVCCGDVSC